MFLYAQCELVTSLNVYSGSCGVSVAPDISDLNPPETPPDGALLIPPLGGVGAVTV